MSDNTLYPGDTVMIIGYEGPADYQHVLGEVCQVISGPHNMRHVPTNEWASVYIVDFPVDDLEPGEYVAFRREHLKKLDDDGDAREKTTWDDCVFSPSEAIVIEEA